MALLIKSFRSSPDARRVLSEIHHNGWDISQSGVISFWEYEHSQNVANEAIKKLPTADMVALNKETFRTVDHKTYRSSAGYIKGNIQIIPLVVHDRYEFFTVDKYFDRLSNEVISISGETLPQIHDVHLPYWDILCSIRGKYIINIADLLCAK